MPSSDETWAVYEPAEASGAGALPFDMTRSPTSLLRRADAIGSSEPLSDFLHAKLAFRQKDYAMAAQILEGLDAKDYRDIPIYLFLADIYQYHLQNPAKAIQALTKALAIREDSETRARLEGLKTDQEKPPA